MSIIRNETTADLQAIEALYQTVSKSDGAILAQLRKQPKFSPELSFVAELDGRIIAHILYFPVSVVYNRCRSWTLFLSPAAVLPDFKRKGHLTELVNKSLAVLKEKEYKSVLVNGHPDFYKRFGFQPADQWNILLPEEKKQANRVLLGLELAPNGFAGLNGTIQFPFIN